MPVTALSSKGQVVIPKEIRAALGLKPGSKLNISLQGEKILLEPVNAGLGSMFYGRYRDVDLLGELEEEHRYETGREEN